MVDGSQTPAAAPFPDRLRMSVQALFAGVFIVLLLVLAGGQWLRHEEALRSGASRAANLALVLGDHLDRTVSAIDTTLGQIALHGGRVGGPKAPSDAWTPMLQAAKAGLAGIGNVSVIDETGIVTHSTIPSAVGESRADLGVFRRLMNEPIDGTLADSPFRGRITGQWVIPVGRRLTAPDGRFAGILIATIEPGLLRDFYRTVDVGENGVIWLVHPAGSVLLREPPAVSPSETVSDNPFHGAANATGVLRGSLEPGGEPYLSAYRRVVRAPVTVAVSLSEWDVLTAWRRQAITSTGVIAFVGIFLLFAGRRITREINARAGAEARLRAQAGELSAALDKHEKADAALRTNEALFQSIMDHAPLMVSLRDLSGRFTFINRAYVAFAGQSEDSIVGKTLTELRPKEVSEPAAATDRDVIEGGGAAQWELTIAKPTGPRTVLVAKFPVYDEAGRINSVGTVLTDITDQKRTEAQLAQAQRMEAVGQLTGGIAHDFNNLLTALLLNADVLVSQIKDDRLRPLAEAMRMAAERGADLTRRLLAFGRRQILEPRPTDVKELLAGMEPLMRRTLGEHIHIEFRHAANLSAATVDPGQLENAVLNLAVNARDAMPNGGKLTIETADAELDEAYAAITPDVVPGDYVMVAVEDSGSGMAPDVVARAFEPFFTTKEVGRGTGLGLSMVYGFVKQSGGHARIYSEAGIGTVVRIYLPRSEVAAAAPEIAPPMIAEVPTGDETILFVEDDPLVRRHTETQLVSLGYHVVTAESGAAALALVEDGCAPDLLFTDMVMPGGINGRELARRLLARWPHLPVLYCSGYAHGTLAIEGEPVPAKYMLGKPYRRRDLAAKLREVLDERVAAAE